MRGLSQELVIALIFAGIWLVQFLYKFLYKRWRRKAESMQAEHEAEVTPVAVASTVVPAAAPRLAAAPKASTPLPMAPRTVLRARRYSRAALMPDRRAVQDAIVIAAILQPCHANRARDDK